MAARKNKVLFINSELEYEEGKNQNKLREQDIEKIISTFDTYQDIKRYAKVVDISEIKENDFNLNIRRYADTSPPPEIFDVRAILHGGIPVREVQSDYMQEEILAGFDVLTVFDKRDDELSADQGYYEFKAEITSKEYIRILVDKSASDVNATVITQLERWWDKYKVSLRELDEQVATAEVEMKGYLKELGYE